MGCDESRDQPLLEPSLGHQPWSNRPLANSAPSTPYFNLPVDTPTPHSSAGAQARGQPGTARGTQLHTQTTRDQTSFQCIPARSVNAARAANARSTWELEQQTKIEQMPLVACIARQMQHTIRIEMRRPLLWWEGNRKAAYARMLLVQRTKVAMGRKSCSILLLEVNGL